MLKSLKQQISRVTGKVRRMTELKNLKISAKTHQALKIAAAVDNVPIMELADRLLCEALEKIRKGEATALTRIEKKHAGRKPRKAQA
jgi:uncharacterized membrane protein